MKKEETLQRIKQVEEEVRRSKDGVLADREANSRELVHG